MNYLPTRWELPGIPFVILVGTALHFAFAWSGYWKPMALLAPVNESVWEHFKLAFWPTLLWAFLEKAMLDELNARAFWSAKGYALLVTPILISIIFYSYTAMLGQNIFALDIAAFVIAVVATQLSSAQLLKANIHTRWGRSIGISLLLCQIVGYSTLTYYPPPLGLFEDGRNGTRGIPPKVSDTPARPKLGMPETGQKQKWLTLNGMSAVPSTTDMRRLHRYVGFVPILLQKSKVASVRVFGETLKREAIDDSDNLSRVTEIAYEFSVRR